MTSYNDLGIRAIINAAATLTRLGGSRMPAPVVEAMVEASKAFVDLSLLQERVGARIAELTHNEACYVSSGAAAGIVLSVAACITGDSLAATCFPQLGEGKNEVIIQLCQRNSYDYAVRQTGARLIQIGATRDYQIEELQRAITPHTACVIYFAGLHYAQGALPLPEVIATAHAHGVPVIVDAAAQIPPIANLWHFTRDLGADIALFSGGKGLRGPQSAGLVLGKRELIVACQRNGNPNQSIGRPMKVGKEELMGMLAAVEWSLAQNEAALIEQYESIVSFWLAGLRDLPGVSAERGFPSEAGQPHARALMRLEAACALTRDELVAALFQSDPPIAVNTLGDDAIALNPQTIEPGEEQIVLQTLQRILGS